jgi:hypothetical protein
MIKTRCKCCPVLMVNDNVGAWIFSCLFFAFIIKAIGAGILDLGSVISSSVYEEKYVPWTNITEEYN